MPLFSSQFDQAVEKATSEMNTSEDWQTILEICDQINLMQPDGPKHALRSISKRLNSNVPLHVMHALTLLDSCVKNCGRKFHLEVCSRDFEAEVKKLLNKGHVKVVEKVKALLKKWTEEDFQSDPELSLYKPLYNSIKLSEVNSQQRERLKGSAVSKKEEEDLAKAIELSLKESGSSPKAPAGSALYPNTSVSHSNSTIKSGKEPRKVRTLYDFIAAEENELSFKANEIILVLDDSDPSWYLGKNDNGEGLFPANFVTSDLSFETQPAKVEKKSVKFNDEVNVKLCAEPPIEEVVIDEEKIDAMLAALHDADPTGQIPDNNELIALEDHCLAMGPLIEQELEQIDHKLTSLTDANKLLVEALKSYETLMKSYPAVPYAPYQGPDVISYQPQAPPEPPHMYNNHTYLRGEPYQPMPIPAGREHFPVPLSGALPTTQSRMVQSVAQPHCVPYDTTNPNSYGNIPHSTSGNYSMPLPSRDANGLYYSDLVANSVQHSTTPISMHQPML